ncbi:MAG: hypothetical protein HKM89_14615 [Gemmatimonadales bacterium]|nr:hypothetical protein [Gemmatimonadales bacterium]
MRKLVLSVLASAAVLGCVSGSGGINKNELMGAWTSGGPSFDFYIQDSTVLYEFDMEEHPYVLDGDVMVVDFGSEELGIQRKQILLLSKDSLVLQDVQTATSTTFHRMQ